MSELNNKYQKGKIYRIYCEDECYIGSTIEPYLSNRFSNHKSKYKKLLKGYTSFLLFEKYGVDNCKIELIEDFPCENKHQLTAREGYYIRNTNCVNKIVIGRSQKEYYNETPEFRDKKKLYYEEHKNEHKEKMKEYYEENKEEYKEIRKIYYQEHKDEIKEKRKEIIKCECGSEITKSNLSNHRKTKKHNSI